MRARVDLLRRAGLTSCAPDPAFDRLARLAVRLLDVPVASVTFVGATFQHSAGAVGVEQRTSVPVSHSLCADVIEADGALVVDDARSDRRFRRHPAVSVFGVVAYLGVPLRAPDGSVLGALCVIEGEPRTWTAEEVAVLEDVAAAAASEIASRISAARAGADRRRLRTVVDAAPMVLFILDREGVFCSVDGGSVGALAASGEHAVGRSVFDVCADNPRIVENCRRALAGEAFDDVVQAGAAWFETRYRPLPDGGVIGVSVDVTRRQLSEARLAHMARHDLVTGLSNRAGLEAELGRALARAERSGTGGAVMVIGLDEFKLVNESLGHSAGDEVLREVAHRLQSVARAGDLVARQDGDEFAVVLEEATAAQALSAAERVRAELAQPLQVATTTLSVGASLGLALAPEHGQSAQDLLRHADRALSQAKQSGRGSIAFYTPQDGEPGQRLTLGVRLRQALKARQFVLHYQPLFRLDTGELVAVEALIRWEDPERGLVPPGAFIDHAEASGLIEDIGAWVIDEVCRQTAAWRRLGLRPRVGFNVTTRQLRQPGFATLISDAIARHRLTPGQLTMEVTESAAMLAPERTIPLLHELRALGLKVAIDDFGAHHSSLARLRALPVDILKIDRAFLRDVPGDARANAMVEAILALGSALELIAVCEGVETDAQKDYLRARGCPLGQGFGLARPADAATTTERLLERATPRHRAHISRA